MNDGLEKIIHDMYDDEIVDVGKTIQKLKQYHKAEVSKVLKEVEEYSIKGYYCKDNFAYWSGDTKDCEKSCIARSKKCRLVNIISRKKLAEIEERLK